MNNAGYQRGAIGMGMEFGTGTYGGSWGKEGAAW